MMTVRRPLVPCSSFSRASRRGSCSADVCSLEVVLGPGLSPPVPRASSVRYPDSEACKSLYGPASWLHSAPGRPYWAQACPHLHSERQQSATQAQKHDNLQAGQLVGWILVPWRLCWHGLVPTHGQHCLAKLLLGSTQTSGGAPPATASARLGQVVMLGPGLSSSAMQGDNRLSSAEQALL